MENNVSFIETPYFKGNIMDVEIDTQEIEGWTPFSDRRLEQSPHNSKKNLTLLSQFSINEEVACESSVSHCTVIYTLIHFAVAYEAPFVDHVALPTSTYLAEGVKTFRSASQAGFHINVIYEDSSLTDIPFTFWGSTKFGDQSESSIEVVQLSKAYNTEKSRMECEALLEVDANLYNSEGEFIGRIQGEFLTYFE